MKENRILYFALGVLTVVSIGAVSLHNEGIEFPDGSFQATAATLTAATAVQGKVSLAIIGLAECTPNTTLYMVPASKRLVIEWLAIETAIFGGALGTHPVDVRITVHDGVSAITHTVARLEDPKSVGSSFFLGTKVVKPVTLYTEANQSVKVQMCFNTDLLDEGVGSVGFSGYLVDV
jgi:hypothetical protein